MKLQVVRANSGKGWVIWDGHSVPTSWFPTKAEAEEEVRQTRALEAAAQQRQAEIEQGLRRHSRQPLS